MLDSITVSGRTGCSDMKTILDLIVDRVQFLEEELGGLPIREVLYLELSTMIQEEL